METSHRSQAIRWFRGRAPWSAALLALASGSFAQDPVPVGPMAGNGYAVLVHPLDDAQVLAFESQAGAVGQQPDHVGNLDHRYTG